MLDANVLQEIKKRIDPEVINVDIYTGAVSLLDNVYAVFVHEQYADKIQAIIQDLKDRGKKVLVYDLITPQGNLERANIKEIFNTCYHLCTANTRIDDLVELAKIAGEPFDADAWLMKKKIEFVNDLKLAANVRPVKIPDWIKNDPAFQCDVAQIELIKSLRLQRKKQKIKMEV